MQSVQPITPRSRELVQTQLACFSSERGNILSARSLLPKIDEQSESHLESVV